MMKCLYFLTLFQVTWQLTQLLPNQFYQMNDRSRSVTRWESIISHVHQTEFIGSGPINKFKHGSPADVEKYYLNSVIAGCGGTNSDTLTCLCPTIYEKTTVVKNDKEGSLAVVTVNKKFKQIVVSYRATTVDSNWLTNYDYPLVDADFLDGAKVHRGFQRHYKTLRSGTHAAVIKLLKQPRYSGYTLHITGYSLGAAIATISAIDWFNLLRKRKDHRKIEIYSYAGPRVGNKAFVDKLSSMKISITRFTSSNDIVPHVPPRTSGYLHAGTELYYDPNIGKIRICNQEVYEDPSCNQGHARLSSEPHTNLFDRPMNSQPRCM